MIGLEDSSRYAPGTTLWRTGVIHFTPWDCNWPYGPPTNATPPNPEGIPDIETPGDEAWSELQSVDDATCTEAPNDTECINSYVKKRGRVFHEDIPIPGTDMTLHYASNRVEGYQQVITVPASGATVSASLKKIVVEVEVAGRTFSQTLEPLADQQAQFIWDGLDHMGRKVAGTVND
ncbi:MAG: hypothetical protein D3910_21500 [Candidatus Electrothrix sp. ATG2]|nr:hypothetical protein [Candidatus Electrothrix sp. ATG2]